MTARELVLKYSDLDASGIVVVRSGVCLFLRACGMQADHVEDIKLLVGELAANAVKHGRDKKLEVAVGYTQDEIKLSFRANSYRRRRDREEILERIRAIESGEYVRTSKTVGGIGLCLLCSMTEATPIIDKGRLVAVLLPSNWFPRKALCSCETA